MGKSLTQVVVRTAAWTLLFAFSAFAYGIALFALACPTVMARFCDTLGAYNAAGMHYERVYNASKTSENLYIVVTVYIAAGNDGKVITFAEILFERPDCAVIIAGANERGKVEAQDNPRLLVALANEDNRLKCMYIAALLNTNQKAKAEGKLAQWYDAAKVNISQPLHAFFLASWDSETLTEKFIEYARAVEASPGAEENPFAKNFLNYAGWYL